jgi:DNA-binding response OmpR family regulator
MALRKVLIAEDELIVARVLQRILEKQEFEVVQVSDAKSAVEAACAFIPDIIIVDIQLKGKSSGIHAGIEIRKSGLTCPIIFTTGNSYDQTKEEIKEISNCHLLIKPVDTHELVEYLQTIQLA